MQQAADDLERMVGAVSAARWRRMPPACFAPPPASISLPCSRREKSAAATGFVQKAADDARNVSAASTELAASISEIGNQIVQANCGFRAGCWRGPTAVSEMI